jgi:hypothetical protein
MTATSQPHVERALEVVDAERTLLERERAAFERFLRRADRAQVAAASGPDLGPGQSTLVTSDSPPDGLRELRAAYRETVMAVSHYEEEYGESLAENVSAEFGESVAIALEEAEAFTPGLRRTLVDGADTARDRRNSLVRAIEREESTLRSAAGTLSEVESDVEAADGSTLSLSFEELMDRWGRLYDLEQECERVLEERQEAIQSGYGVPLRLDGPISLQEYLYDSLPVTHPVLAEATRMLESVRRVQDATSVALSRRV